MIRALSFCTAVLFIHLLTPAVFREAAYFNTTITSKEHRKTQSALRASMLLHVFMFRTQLKKTSC